jgi:hypothetical protein
LTIGIIDPARHGVCYRVEFQKTLLVSYHTKY